MPGIERAIEAAGGVAALARSIGVTHQAVSQWRARGWAPPSRAMQMEECTGVPRRDLVSPAIADLFA